MKAQHPSLSHPLTQLDRRQKKKKNGRGAQLKSKVVVIGREVDSRNNTPFSIDIEKAITKLGNETHYACVTG